MKHILNTIQNKKNYFIPALILGAALLLRLHYLLTVSPNPLTHDEYFYNEMVENFLTKGYLGYKDTVPNAFITPGYPLFLAGIYIFADLFNADRLFIVRLIQVFLSAGTVGLTYLLANRAAGKSTAILAAAVVAFYPPFLWANTRILTEVLFTFLISLYSYLVLINFNNAALLPHTLSGTVLALAVLVRPAAAPVIVIPYVLTYLKTGDRAVFRQFISAAGGFCLVMLPWWVRNYIQFKELIILATQTGNPLLRGADPYDPYDHIGPSVIEGIAPQDQKRVAIRRIINGFKTDPGLWLSWYTIGKLKFLWARPWGYVHHLLKAGLILHSWIVFLSILGAVLGFRKLSLQWLAAIPVFFTLIQLAFIPLNRYMFPVMPEMIILAAAAITGLCNLAGKKAKIFTKTMP